MSQFYNPTSDERRALQALAEEVSGVQRTLVTNHPRLTQPDRGAHQPQLGAGKVLLHVSDTLPPELDRLGIFAPTGPPPPPPPQAPRPPPPRPASGSAACRTVSGAPTPKPRPTSSG